MKSKTLLATLLCTAALTAITGCQSHDDTRHGEVFYENGQTTHIGQMAQAQAAAGAKADSMLYARQFDGDELNSLGEAKMDLILKGTRKDQPVKLYFVMAHDAMSAREASVKAYLKKAGVTPDETIFAEGPNPDDHTPAAYNLAEIYTLKTNDQTLKTNYSGQAADMPPAGPLVPAASDK